MTRVSENLHGLIALFVLLLHGAAYAQPAPPPAECRQLHIVRGDYDGPKRFDRGLLWKISRPGSAPSYLFGTIHLGDEDVTRLPEAVSARLKKSRVFVMEALPDMEQSTKLSQMMFFGDHRRLNEFLSGTMYDRVVAILATYHLTEESASLLKPWAAFLTMSYPSDLRKILDLQLLEMASENGLEARGLETLQEQGEIFNRMKMQDQVRLLTDAACHYDRFQKDFEVMKSLYLKRDLKALYLYSQRYSFNDNSVYESLSRQILTDRNHVMADRMQPILEKGNAFIAIGAMHLPGKEGVLALLQGKKFRISRVY
jgi:uncharacterized protein YbaP (TraB family)